MDGEESLGNSPATKTELESSQALKSQLFNLKGV